jgi:hypothetical protein
MKRNIPLKQVCLLAAVICYLAAGCVSTGDIASSGTPSSASVDEFGIALEKAISLADHVLEMTPEQLKAYLKPHELKDLSLPGEDPFFTTSGGYPHKFILGTIYTFNNGVVHTVACIFGADNTDNTTRLLDTLVGGLIQLYGNPEREKNPSFAGNVYVWTIRAPSGNRDKDLFLFLGRERTDDVDVISLNVGRARMKITED